MIVGIEYLKTLEFWAPKQERIYGDACDCGLWARPGSKLEGILRKAIHGLCKVYRHEVQRWGRADRQGTTILTFVPFEKDGDEIVGVLVRVAQCPTRRSQFISIDFSRDVWSKARLTMGMGDAASPFLD